MFGNKEMFALSNKLTSENAFVMRFELPNVFYIAYKRNGRTDDEIARLAREVKVFLIVFAADETEEVVVKYKIFESEEEKNKVLDDARDWLIKTFENIK